MYVTYIKRNKEVKIRNHRFQNKGSKTKVLIETLALFKKIRV